MTDAQFNDVVLLLGTVCLTVAATLLLSLWVLVGIGAFFFLVGRFG